MMNDGFSRSGFKEATPQIQIKRLARDALKSGWLCHSLCMRKRLSREEVKEQIQTCHKNFHIYLEAKHYIVLDNYKVYYSFVHNTATERSATESYT